MNLHEKNLEQRKVNDVHENEHNQLVLLVLKV